MKKFLVIACAALASCTTSPQVISDRHTGSTVIVSSVNRAQESLLSSTHARPFYSNKTGYGFNTAYMATGTGWLHINQAWSNGRQLRYEYRSSNVLGCGGGCTINEGGAVFLSESEFRAAARTGFEFQLRGPNGAVDGKIPAKAFQEVLDLQANKKPA